MSEALAIIAPEMVALPVKGDIGGPIPDDVLRAALKIMEWAKRNNYQRWAMGDICSTTFIRSVVDVPTNFNGSPTWPYVIHFGELMEYKLSLKRHRGNREGWIKDNPWALLKRLSEEFGELAVAFKRGDAQGACLECADVGNFAMMISDVLSERPESIKERPVGNSQAEV